MAMNADKQEIRKVTDHMNELLYREEMMWLQRSRINWLKEGDRNTQKFHKKVVWRARKNKIKWLVDLNGVLQQEAPVMRTMAKEYFETIFTSDPSLTPATVVDLIEEKVTLDMNLKLCADFTIGDALFQIEPLKAPGPDGFPTRFFQRNWGVLQKEIVVAVKKFFEIGIMPSGINDTTLVLIPKVDNPKKMSDLRPISLCNVIYKVVSKCLVNRLRPVLEDIISEEQSAFVPGRLITDNAPLAFECLHHIHTGKNSDNNYCAYKLDLSKEYDGVDWGFLRQIMEKLGFDHRWVDWIMTCVTTVRYSIKFNGALSDLFAPSRGLRQCDPLSPFSVPLCC
jgi:hypothetical protein